MVTMSLAFYPIINSIFLGLAHRLYVSYNRGQFRAAQFPENLQQKDYHVVSSDQGFVMMAVNHEHGTSQLFSSNERGDTYRLVLSNIRYFQRKRNNLSLDTAYTADVHDVKGLNGCFIANQHWTGGRAANKTVITWDSGKTWHNLTIEEEVESTWRVKQMSDGDTLNLHLVKTQTDIGFYAPPILSKESSPGYIVAHGVVGQTIEERPEKIDLYISTDGGRHWRQRRPTGLNGRFVSTFMDSGAITIAVQMNPYTPQNQLHFSTTEGLRWQNVQFAQDKINVDAILTEPGELTSVVTIFGHTSWQKPWQIFTVNMTEQAENCQDKDYINWEYTDCSKKESKIGMKVTFKRRKTEVSCLNGPQFKRDRNETNCPDCQLDDYFCSSGWKPTEDFRCRNDDHSSQAEDPSMIKKTNLRPIKAPGNKCVKEFDWVNHDFSGKEINLRILDDNGKPSTKITYPMYVNAINLKFYQKWGFHTWKNPYTNAQPFQQSPQNSPYPLTGKK